MTPKVTYTSIDPEARTVTCEVEGVGPVTRNVPSQFEGTIEDYIRGLMDGLAIEFTVVDPKPLPDSVKP